MFQVASPTMSATGRSVRKDVPQSPCTKSPSQWRYCSGTRLVEVVFVLEVAGGVLRHSRAMAQVAQRIARAETSANTTIVASSTTTSAVTSRRTTNAITANF